VTRAALATAAALYLLSAWPEPAELRHDGAPGAEPEGAAALLFGRRLDPNRAPAASLELLPGIGPARAEAIAAARCRRRFDTLADLERVPGIGPVTRAGLAPWLAIDPGSPADCAGSER
jgi:DNA uptake protein ComE-like DNA-binding protein